MTRAPRLPMAHKTTLSWEEVLSCRTDKPLPFLRFYQEAGLATGPPPIPRAALGACPARARSLRAATPPPLPLAALI